MGGSRIFTSPHSNLYMVFTDEEIVDAAGDVWAGEAGAGSREDFIIE